MIGKRHELLTAVVAICLLASLAGSVVDAEEDARPALGTRGLGVLCIDDFPVRAVGAEARGRKAAVEQASVPANYPPYPLEDTFILHSLPGAHDKLYFDFDGHSTYPAWDMDGDSSTFSDAERLLIQKMWYLTSEDFLPFTIDVTTEEPGSGFPGMRAVVDGSAEYGYGWAYMGTWPDSDNFAYTGIWDNDWIYIAQAASHEVGHTLNLDDHGQTDDTGYYMGHGSGWTEWGVIMGWDSWSVGVWDIGEFPIPNHPEDSLAIIVGPENPDVDYRPDDHGSTIGTATAITLPATLELVAEGIIEQNTDVDYFAFTTSGGNVQFSINEDVVMGTSNLDVLAKIHDSDGAVLYESNPLWEIWASFYVTLPAGNYYLSIDGTGQDHPDGEPEEGFGYSDYGILGYYTIKAGRDDDPIAALVSGVSQSSYQEFHLDVESSGLGLYGGALYNQGYRNRDFDPSTMSGTLGNQEAQLYIQDKFTAMGLSVSVQGSYLNVVGELRGTTTPNNIYILGAHFDHIAGDMPGGDDNASGTAGVLEAARVLSQHQFESTIRFICFNAEEDGLKGSRDYVNNHIIPNDENIVGMVNLDMILRPGSDAEPERPIDVEFETDGAMSWVEAFTQTMTDYAPSLVVGDIWDGMGYSSDNEALTDAGIPAFLVIENSWGDWYDPNPIANSYYHTSEDASDRLANDPYSPSGVTYDYAFATNVVRTAVAFLAQKAELSVSSTPAPIPLTWDLAPTTDFTPPTTLAGLTGNEALTTTPLASHGTEEEQLANLLTDEFAYNPGNPTWPMPVLNDALFHGRSAELSTITYDLDDVYDNLFVDLYGRSTCCWDRDDSFNVEFWLDGVLQETVAGSVDGDFHGRVAASPATEADQIRIVETAVSPNYFTLCEIRVYSSLFPPFDSDTMIAMVATTTSHPDGVQYFFACTAGVGNDSGWQDSPIYIDMGLTPGTQYTYHVLAGDKSDEQDLTGWSVPASATTTDRATGDPVPDVVGITEATAKFVIVAAGLKVGTAINEYSDSVPEGFVISQSPVSGTLLVDGSSVDIVVSRGLLMVTVPDVTGMEQATAEADIIAAVLTVGTLTTEYDYTIPAGDVISQNPDADASVIHDTAVDIVVSLGAEMAVVPDVVGMTQAGAKWAIRTANLTVGSVITVSSDTVPDGRVISQNPSADASVVINTPVDLVVSQGDTTPPNPNPATWAISPERVVASI